MVGTMMIYWNSLLRHDCASKKIWFRPPGNCLQKSLAGFSGQLYADQKYTGKGP